jgi:hypothetical protein
MKEAGLEIDDIERNARAHNIRESSVTENLDATRLLGHHPGHCRNYWLLPLRPACLAD